VKFIHLSDTHLLGATSEKLYGLKPAKRLKKAFKNIREHHSDAAFVVITGDMANTGEVGAYTLLKKYINGLGIPVYPLMGNHDSREAFWEIFPEWKGGEFVQYVREIDGRVFVFLDTLVEGEEYGMLCDARLVWLAKQLDHYFDREMYLFMHHHPIVSGLYRMDTVGNFRSTEAFWALLARYDSVRHVFFGHVHRSIQARHQGIPLSSTRSTTFQVSYRPDEKEESLTNTVQPAYSVVSFREADTIIHLCEYLSEYGVARVV
jgi:3',5'-cyclic AMP phosphodiesterase CpdA